MTAMRQRGFVVSLVSVVATAAVLAGALWEHVSPAATFVAGAAVCVVALIGLPFTPGEAVKR